MGGGLAPPPSACARGLTLGRARSVTGRAGDSRALAALDARPRSLAAAACVRTAYTGRQCRRDAAAVRPLRRHVGTYAAGRADTPRVGAGGGEGSVAARPAAARAPRAARLGAPRRVGRQWRRRCCGGVGRDGRPRRHLACGRRAHAGARDPGFVQASRGALARYLRVATHAPLLVLPSLYAAPPMCRVFPQHAFAAPPSRRFVWTDAEASTRRRLEDAAMR
jgi:hypothetical protein